MQTNAPNHPATAINIASTASQDLPPAYTPHSLPPYTHFDPQADHENYAISLMMHNLRMSQRPTHSGVIQEEDIEHPDRIQRAAIRDFRASHDPAQWGLRPSQLRGQVRQQEERGFWGRLIDLFNPGPEEEMSDRDRYINGLPFWFAPNGAI